MYPGGRKFEVRDRDDRAPLPGAVERKTLAGSTAPGASPGISGPSPDPPGTAANGPRRNPDPMPRTPGQIDRSILRQAVGTRRPDSACNFCNCISIRKFRIFPFKKFDIQKFFPGASIASGDPDQASTKARQTYVHPASLNAPCLTR